MTLRPGDTEQRYIKCLPLDLSRMGRARITRRIGLVLSGGGLRGASQIDIGQRSTRRETRDHEPEVGRYSRLVTLLGNLI
jgi:hypothetical protein